MSWIFLLIAAALEVVWAVALKQSNGFKHVWPSVIAVVGMILSVGFLSLALRGIPLGTGYAIWTGLGAAGTAVCGMLFFHEPATALRLASLVLILAGVVGLKLFS